MTGLSSNATFSHACRFSQYDAQEIRSHHVQGGCQSRVQSPIHTVCQQILSLKRHHVPPLCTMHLPRDSCQRRVSSRVYASLPNFPSRELHVQEEEEKPGSAQEGLEKDPSAEEGASQSSWRKLPPRYKLILSTAIAFVICNMDKVNMSVTIIPMSRQLGWSSTIAGLVQSSFFWGYALSQLPGGWLAKTFSGQRVLCAGLLVWSLATAAVPCTANLLPGLLLCRFMVGLGEGVSPAAATDLIARAMPVSERSRAVATTFGGLYVGSVVGLLLSPVIIAKFCWEAVFYIFGLLGIVWYLLFECAVGKSMVGDDASNTESPSTTPEMAGGSSSNGTLVNHNGGLRQRQTPSPGESNGKPHPSATPSTFTAKKVPWKAFFKSPAVWAMIYAHFSGNWGHYTLLSWLPTYFSEELHLDLTLAATVSIFSPLASVAVASVAAPLADHYISRGYDISLVRKVCQLVAFLSPAICMVISALTPKLNPWLDVAILSSGLGLSSFTLAGLYCTHQDISPKYASILLGITSTVGAIPGVLGVALVGFIYDRTHSWNLALFAPSIFFYLTGAMVWSIFASSKPQSFES